MTFTPNPNFFDPTPQTPTETSDFFGDESTNSNFTFDSPFQLPYVNNFSVNDDSFLYQMDQFTDNDPIFSFAERQHRRTYTAPVTIPSTQQSFPALPQNGVQLTHQGAVQFQPRTGRKQLVYNWCSEDVQFFTLCRDTSIKINPYALHFIPAAFWTDTEFSFGDIVYDFFQRKNNNNSRFPYKLFNALSISHNCPSLSPYMGVKWVNDTILQVDKREFARLLGIKSIDGSLFHQQGNFPTHGFVELTLDEIRSELGEETLRSFNTDNTKFLQHQDGSFVRSSTQEQIEQCKWVSARIRKLNQ